MCPCVKNIGFKNIRLVRFRFGLTGTLPTRCMVFSVYDCLIKESMAGGIPTLLQAAATLRYVLNQTLWHP